MMYSVLSFGQNSPQIYNNFFFGWKINESWSLGSELSYNFLYNEPSAWNEWSLSTVARRTLGKVSMVTGGLYFGNTRQNKNLSNWELRPVLGYRLFSNTKKHFGVANYTRIEFRFFKYSNNTIDETTRLRNRTTFTFSLSKKSLSAAKNFLVFSFLEAFHNFDENTVERYFKLFKVKLGIAYIIDDHWFADAGVLYLDSENNAAEPSQLPTVYDTNYILELGIGYRLK